MNRKRERSPKQLEQLAKLHERYRAGEWCAGAKKGVPQSEEYKVNALRTYKNTPPETLKERARKRSQTRIHQNIAKEPDRGIKFGMGCKRILILHHEQLKDDPERLTSEFIAELIGCNCPRKRVG